MPQPNMKIKNNINKIQTKKDKMGFSMISMNLEKLTKKI